MSSVGDLLRVETWDECQVVFVYVGLYIDLLHSYDMMKSKYRPIGLRSCAINAFRFGRCCR